MVLVTCYQEKQAALSVSVSLPGAQGGDSHQTEDGLMFPREDFGTCMVLRSHLLCKGCFSAEVSDQEENCLSSTCFFGHHRSQMSSLVPTTWVKGKE